MLEIGDFAPNFTMESDKGGWITLEDLRGKTVVLFFYPKDDTPGCTKESCAFRDHYSMFQSHNIQVLGVSCDNIQSHQKFSNKYNLTFPLLSDHDSSVSKCYEVYKDKTNYGRKYMGIERTTFIIDTKGRIAQVFHNVKVDGHVEKVLHSLVT